METRKIVINRCFGGFTLSHKAIMRYAQIKKIKLYCWIDEIHLKYHTDAALENSLVHYATVPKEQYDKFTKLFKETPLEERSALGDGGYFYPEWERDNPLLIQIIEELKENASGLLSKLKIVEIPNDVEWEIEEYDGMETIHEKHRIWN